MNVADLAGMAYLVMSPLYIFLAGSATMTRRSDKRFRF